MLASAPKGEVREKEDEDTLRPVYIRGQKRHMVLTETAEPRGPFPNLQLPRGFPVPRVWPASPSICNPPRTIWDRDRLHLHVRRLRQAASSPQMCRPGHPLTPSTHGHRVAWRVLTVGHCSQGAVYDGDPAVEGTVHPPSVGAGGGEAGLARRGEGTARLGGAHGSRVSDRDTQLVLSATTAKSHYLGTHVKN